MEQDNMLKAPHDRNGFAPNEDRRTPVLYTSGVDHKVDGLTHANLREGTMTVTDEKTSVFDPDQYGGTTHEGDPLKQGGFLSRPRGWAR